MLLITRTYSMNTTTVETLKQKLRRMIEKLRDQVRKNKMLFVAGVAVTIALIVVGVVLSKGALKDFQTYVSIGCSLGIMGPCLFCMRDIKTINERITGIELFEIQYLDSDNVADLEKANAMFDGIIKDYLTKS